MEDDEDYILLSAIQHYVFCPRQCFLAYIAGIWDENRFTARGHIMHEKVDSGEDDSRGMKQLVRSLYLKSERLRVVGKADMVEFHYGENGIAVPFPVEYKSGKPKQDTSDIAHLCGQAICLEEMLEVNIPSGAIYYGRTRRRYEVSFSEEIRNETEDIIKRIHEMSEIGEIPKARFGKKCRFCSLKDQCQPGTGSSRSLRNYIETMYEEI